MPLYFLGSIGCPDSFSTLSLPGGPAASCQITFQRLKERPDVLEPLGEWMRMSFSSLNTRALLFACPMFTVIENIACRNTHKKRRTKKKEKKIGGKKIKKDNPGLLHVHHQLQKNTALLPSFIDVVSYVSMPSSIHPHWVFSSSEDRRWAWRADLFAHMASTCFLYCILHRTVYNVPVKTVKNSLGCRCSSILCVRRLYWHFGSEQFGLRIDLKAYLAVAIIHLVHWHNRIFICFYLKLSVIDVVYTEVISVWNGSRQMTLWIPPSRLFPSHFLVVHFFKQWAMQSNSSIRHLFSPGRKDVFVGVLA